MLSPIAAFPDNQYQHIETKKARIIFNKNFKKAPLMFKQMQIFR